VLSDLEELGYTCEPVVVGAVHAGAPHRRQRAWLVAHADGKRAEHEEPNIRIPRQAERGLPGGCGEAVDDALCGRHGGAEGQVCAGGHSPVGAGWWSTEPAVGRVASRVPNRVDRLRALGNSVVPQVVTTIGHAILAASHAGSR
jgi:DNA (cytosine-5)-methyltransferase 1